MPTSNSSEPIYALDKSRSREVKQTLRSMWDMVPDAYYVVPDCATYKIQLPSAPQESP